MSIQAELNRLNQAKLDLRTAILNKGVTVPVDAKLEEYASAISQISTGEILGAAPPATYEFRNVVVTADGVDVTSQVFVDGKIDLSGVIGHIELSLDTVRQLETPVITLWEDTLATPEIELWDDTLETPLIALVDIT